MKAEIIYSVRTHFKPWVDYQIGGSAVSADFKEEENRGNIKWCCPRINSARS